MFDFINSIFNIIGDNINKLIDLCFGKKKEELKKSASVSASDSDLLTKKSPDRTKPSAWTRKKK